ncbi:MAG: serine hydrolase [Lachnospiraceae bacterium]|nr:serine hydrolase [Lachnospiraceae bacterium]
MDFLNNNVDEEYEAARRDRRAKMKEEKQKQAMKRAMLKKMIPLIAVGVCALALMITAIVWLIGKITSSPHRDSVEIMAAQVPEQIVQEEVPIEENEVEAMMIRGMPEIEVALPQMAEGYDVDYTNATSAISEEEVQSRYASLINATTGEAILSKNGRDRMYPASMTKVMTVLVACEHITDLNDEFEITIEDTDYAYIHDLSCAGFEAGEKVPVKDILYGAIMPSGGECCHALERYVAGDEDKFIEMMNDKAKELGLTGTHYTNSAGLYSDDHYTTLYDMSMVMKAAIENDLCRQILHKHIYVTKATEQHPEGLELSNWFQRRIEDKYTKTEVLGAKTGYVVQAGNCAVSYTVGDDGTVYICATGNAHSAWRAIYDHVSLYDKYVK